ncbi:MAG: gluconokinase [Opitutae bacterium]|jgi:carbohydrate kinase (thermoresistant glucokinase family)|nr:gluconokinase [Opitutae bacterium]
MVGVIRNIVLMGVSGCGKSLVGEALASKLDLKFIEGDEFHTPENKKKMGSGIPLNDDDRLGWLKILGDLANSSEQPLIISCSALKKSYRDILDSKGAKCIFVHLHASREVIEGRIRARKGHFFDPRLLTSQFDTLEPLEHGEQGFQVNVANPEHLVLAEIISRLDDWNI